MATKPRQGAKWVRKRRPICLNDSAPHRTMWQSVRYSPNGPGNRPSGKWPALRRKALSPVGCSAPLQCLTGYFCVSAPLSLQRGVTPRQTVLRGYYMRGPFSLSSPDRRRACAALRFFQLIFYIFYILCISFCDLHVSWPGSFSARPISFSFLSVKLLMVPTKFLFSKNFFSFFLFSALSGKK